jgi:hypothetical protein
MTFVQTPIDDRQRQRRQELIDHATAIISVPRVQPADSFVLHAPLNLMARIGLLDNVQPKAIPAAEAAIESTVERYEASGAGVEPPRTLTITHPSDAARALAAAMRAGDLDDVDALTHWLTARLSASAIGHLVGELVVDSLAAAGHAPIGFHLFQRVQAGSLPSSLLRGTTREIARNPDWRIRWFRGVNDPHEAIALDAALASLPHLGRPGSDFIFPLMSQIETSGVGPEMLGSVLLENPDVASVRRTLTRAAAVCMLHGDPAHAPYGWTHALTMPQGTLALASAGVSPRTAAAVAMTFFAGFRVAYDSGPTGSLTDGAASDYLSPDASMPDETALATFAALHHDEHLVKYTLACLHAADDDPAWRAVYLRAAGYLADWWRANPDAGFD